MHPLLESFKPIVQFLGAVLGKDSEVVLHDITDVNKSIIAIANKEVSGRDIGAPATDLALKVLKSGKYQDKDFLVNYRGESSTGKVFRSSTFFIRDEKRNIIGMLCLNIDRSQIKQVYDYIKPLLEEPSSQELDLPQEVLSHSVEELAFESVKNIIAETGIPPQRLNHREKKDIVRRLNDDGVFLLKGSIPWVSQRLHVSDATLYRYINTIKNDENSL